MQRTAYLVPLIDAVNPGMHHQFQGGVTKLLDHHQRFRRSWNAGTGHGTVHQDLKHHLDIRSAGHTHGNDDAHAPATDMQDMLAKG
jgi:hypothetical protein